MFFKCMRKIAFLLMQVKYMHLVDFPQKFCHSIKIRPSGLNSGSGVALKGHDIPSPGQRPGINGKT